MGKVTMQTERQFVTNKHKFKRFLPGRRDETVDDRRSKRGATMDLETTKKFRGCSSKRKKKLRKSGISWKRGSLTTTNSGVDWRTL